MAKWRRLAGGKDPGDIDYQRMCDDFSNMTSAGIRYEKHGDDVTLYTDGDPAEVLATLTTFCVIYEALDEIEQEMRFQRNARMN